MTRHDLSELTTLVANNIMLFHEIADYDGLEKNTVGLVRELGYPEDVARKCARVVRDIYRQCDVAQEFHEKGDEAEERKQYSIVHSLADQLNILLDSGYRTNNYVDIVFYWRHKRRALALLAMLRDWTEKLGVKNLPYAAYCTYLLVRAGFNHDKRDRKEFERNMSLFWTAVMSANRNEKLPILF